MSTLKSRKAPKNEVARYKGEQKILKKHKGDLTSASKDMKAYHKEIGYNSKTKKWKGL